MKRVLVVLMVALVSGPVMAKSDKGPHGAEPLPHGLAKKVARGGHLPPGWQKKLQKGKPLEPELYRLAQPVPDSIRVKLPVGPNGSVEIRLEGKIVRLHRATHEILDVFDIH